MARLGQLFEHRVDLSGRVEPEGKRDPAGILGRSPIRMHASDGLLGVEREPVAAGKLQVDVRVRSLGLGNRQPQLPVERDRTVDIPGEYLDDC